MSETTEEIPRGGSGTPGCIILGAIITVFGGLIILYTVIFFVQKKAFAGFTQEAPAEIRVMEPTEAQVTALNEKLFAIKAATTQDRIERILLTKDDLNTLIATAEILKDFRGKTYIESISDRGMETHMTQQIRNGRYLNARFIFYPELRRRTIALRVRDIISDVGSVPDQFVKNYDTIGFFKLDPENENVKPYMGKLSRVYLEGGNVVIETGPPADDQTPISE